MKEGLEKEIKKLDSSEGKDGETTTSNSDGGKKKSKEERLPTKVVVRRLPPTMTEEEFRQQVDPLPAVDYMYYVPADNVISNNPFCRAYINFTDIADVFIFSQKFDGYVFVDNKGMEYPAIVEFAPFQRIPKLRTGKKKDLKTGTLETEPAYVSFLDQLETENQERIAVGNTAKQHFFETNVDPNEDKKAVTTTPLLDFLRVRHTERMKVREEKRKKDMERRRARDEQRRNAKKPEEDSSLVKPPVVSMKVPKTEEERLMEQQTIFLRKLLGLPIPCKQVSRRSSNGDVEDLSSKLLMNDSVIKLFNDDSLTSVRRDYYKTLSVRESLNSGGKLEKSRYSNSKRADNGIKLYPANGYWKRDVPSLSEGQTRHLWNQHESRYSNSKMSFAVTPFCNGKYKDFVASKFENRRVTDHFEKLKGNVCNQTKNVCNFRKDLLDETAFPTLEKNKVSKLQKNIMKSQTTYNTSPIKIRSVEEIKMKFQLWSHDVTTKSSSGKKKDLKKVELSQVNEMPPPSSVIQNGINKLMRENDQLGMHYESSLKDDTSNKDKAAENASKSANENIDYFTSGYKSFIKTCPVNDIASEGKNNCTNNNSRFLISNNMKLPKAFSSGRKHTADNISLSPDHVSLPNDFPKAFNSLLKSDSNKHGCGQSHRNEALICSSESSSNISDNINRKSSPFSIIC